jgi:hypothetical protein
MEHLLLSAILATGLVSTPAPRSSSLQPCPTTTSNQNQPPASVLAKAGLPEGVKLHGNGQLWTALWPDGNVVFKKGGPGQIMADGSLRMKFLWVLAGDGPLTQGRRLDGDTGPLRSVIQVS